MAQSHSTGILDVIASVAAAYAGRPDTSADDILNLVARLSSQLSGFEANNDGASAAATAGDSRLSVAPEHAPITARVSPALPLDQAVTNDKVYCLCCGKGFKMLKRHLGSEHGLSEDDYRAMFELPADMPLVAPSYSERKAAYAKQVGLGKYNREESGAERAN
ncbi:MucR family transcriptional regulator [Thioclava sp. BHET1]|nr:MucR family transcriptional regulator [Thioclava sp. BHET1]